MGSLQFLRWSVHKFRRRGVAEIRFHSGLQRPTNCLQSRGRCLSFVENLRMLQRG